MPMGVECRYTEPFRSLADCENDALQKTRGSSFMHPESIEDQRTRAAPAETLTPARSFVFRPNDLIHHSWIG